MPLVLFCHPNSWRNQLEQISAERKVSLNVALEADSLSLQTHIACEGGVYALSGPYAIASPVIRQWLVETRLRGWGGRTRTQKCRRKLSF
jgi:hypothetical protein